MKNNIIMTVPYKNGGISSFVNNLLPYMSNLILFYRGSKNKKSLLKDIFLPIRFIFCLFKNRPYMAIINTSLSVQSMLRDGILVRIAALCGCTVKLIVHGFQEKALEHYAWMLHIGYFRADSISVSSDVYRKKLYDLGYNKKIMVQYNPIEKSMCMTIDKLKVTKDLCNIKNILFLSRVETAKGIYILLEAFSMLKEPTLHLHIVGVGSELEGAKQYVQNHDIKNVSFYGFVSKDEKVKLLALSDLFVLPSYTEGLPISVLEAMATGCYILTRPVGGLVDLIKNTNCGVLVDTLKPIDFANAITDIIANEENLQEQRYANMCFAQQNFDPEKIANIINMP